MMKIWFCLFPTYGTNFVYIKNQTNKKKNKKSKTELNHDITAWSTAIFI